MRRLLFQHKRTLALALVACIVVALRTGFRLHYAFNLADEGFVWYGMQRTFHGEVPMRDFMGYDPARYYWASIVMWFAGSDGLMPFRIANAIVEALGLFFAMLVLARVAGNRWVFLTLSCVVLSIWMTPRFKVYDHTASIALVWSLMYLIEEPTRKRYFVSGFVLGLAAFVGRNHGIYGLAATGLAVLYVNLRERPVPIGKAFVSWLGGVFVGYSPMIVMMIFLPGFAYASIEMIRMLAQAGKTNLPLPVPWPWSVEIPKGSSLDHTIGQSIVGFFFIALLAFGVGSLAYVFWKRFKGVPAPAALVACSFLTLPYAHYAFSRADVTHLAFGVYPLLIGSIIVIQRFGSLAQTAFTFLVGLASFVIVLPQEPGRWEKVPMVIDGNHLLIHPKTAGEIDGLDYAVKTYAANGENFYVTPFWPSAYPMYHRLSPVWDLYSLFDRDEAMQTKEIEQIKAAKPAFVMVIDEAPDRDPLLLFRHTNPLIWRYINREYDQVKAPQLKPFMRLYIPKKSQP